MGEEFILSLEADRLKNTGKIPEKVRDGKGYDIRSWDEKGKEIHIEVKTTSRDLEDRIFGQDVNILNLEMTRYIGFTEFMNLIEVRKLDRLKKSKAVLPPPLRNTHRRFMVITTRLKAKREPVPTKNYALDFY